MIKNIIAGGIPIWLSIGMWYLLSRYDMKTNPDTEYWNNYNWKDICIMGVYWTIGYAILIFIISIL